MTSLGPGLGGRRTEMDFRNPAQGDSDRGAGRKTMGIKFSADERAMVAREAARAGMSTGAYVRKIVVGVLTLVR